MKGKIVASGPYIQVAADVMSYAGAQSLSYGGDGNGDILSNPNNTDSAEGNLEIHSDDRDILVSAFYPLLRMIGLV